MKAVHSKVIGIVLNDLDIRNRFGGRSYDYYYRPYSHSHRADQKGD
jgi:hypothetical protein